MEERRHFQRTPSSMRVLLSHPEIGTLMGTTRDISDGGALVMIENHSLPPIGTVLNVVFKKTVGQINELPVKMKVMHSQRNLIGLMFLGR